MAKQKSSKNSKLKEVLASFAEASEVDDQIVAFVKNKERKFKFFLKSGRTTAIAMMVIPALVGLALGYLIGSLL
jgi:hypothetical protein